MKKLNIFRAIFCPSSAIIVCSNHLLCSRISRRSLSQTGTNNKLCVMKTISQIVKLFEISKYNIHFILGQLVRYYQPYIIKYIFYFARVPCKWLSITVCIRCNERENISIMKVFSSTARCCVFYQVLVMKNVRAFSQSEGFEGESTTNKSPALNTFPIPNISR